MVSQPPSPKHEPQKPDDIDYLDFYRPNAVLPSPPDNRDYHAPEHSPFGAAALPVRLILDDPANTDQGPRGSCAAFASAGVFRRAMTVAGLIDFDVAEEYLYAMMRQPHGWLCQDSGSFPKDAFDTAKNVGVCPEAFCTYLSHDLCYQPGAYEYEAAAPYKIASYWKHDSLDQIKQTLSGTGAGDGVSVVACFTLRQNFSPDADANIPAPAGGEWGGHAMRFVGWDDGRVMPDGTVGAMKVANQWGVGWGSSGTAWVSYAMCRLPCEAGGLWLSETWTAIYPAQPQPTPDPQPQPDDTKAKALIIATSIRADETRLAAGRKSSVHVQRAIGAERVRVALGEKL